MNTASEERLKQVHPELARRVRELVMRLSKRGVQLEVVQGLRTFEYQQALYEQGRSRKGPVVTNAKPGQSLHNYGLAVDLCPFRADKPDWDDARAFALLGAEARKLGLEWGGSWRKPDRPHVELSPIPVSLCLSLYQRGRLPLVWSEVERKLPK